MARLSPNVAVQGLPRVGRRLRKPTHVFNVRYRPWALQPFLLAPVLPGDTMKNLLMQGRIVSDPVRVPNMGWWNECYFFYVKLRDLPDREPLEQMLIANVDPGLESAADPKYYYSGEGYNYAKMCLDQVVKHYFRSQEEREADDVYQVIDGMPQCKVNIDNWMESMKIGTDAPVAPDDPDGLDGDFYPELPEHLTGFADAYEQWKQMQTLQMAPATFADYLKTFGVRVPKAEQEITQKPELLRYIREWKMPSVTVDPATAAVGGSVVCDMNERADKDRFFSEPGFIIGIATARPKVLYNKQTSSVANFLTDAFSWLPALLRPDPFTSLKKFLVETGPIPLDGPDEFMDDYWIDLADLFMNGDQFTNVDLATIGNDHKVNSVSLPQPVNPTSTPDASGEIGLNKEYATDADARNLFVDTANTSAAKNFFRMEGRADITLLSSVVDTTP